MPVVIFSSGTLRIAGPDRGHRFICPAVCYVGQMYERKEWLRGEGGKLERVRDDSTHNTLYIIIIFMYEQIPFTKQFLHVFRVV